MSHAWSRAVPIPAAWFLFAVACGPTGVEPAGEATLFLSADVSGTAVATVVVNVTAPDIPTPLLFNIPIVNQVATGTIVVPTGSQRTIAMRAYDDAGVETHAGAVVRSIQPGANPLITIVMQPLTGDVPIEATLGSMTVAVTPPTVALTVSLTSQLTAAITDWNGNAVAGPARWATRDPGIASVDENGLVTAIGTGSTIVVATFQGAAGLATINVTP